MNPLQVAITWLLKKHVKEEKTAMSKILFVLSAMSVIADGATAQTVSIHVTDDAGAVLPDQAVALTGDASVALSAASLTTDANGTATADLTSSTPGTYQITATLADGTSQSFSVVFLAVPLPETEQPVPEAVVVIDRIDLVMAKLKELVAAAGSQAHTVIDDLIDLAKKLA